MPELDLTALDTQQRMSYEFHARRQDAIADEIAALRDETNKAMAVLQRSVDALAESASTKVHSYEQSRLFRALRWLRLL